MLLGAALMRIYIVRSVGHLPEEVAAITEPAVKQHAEQVAAITEPESKILELINAERMRNGLEALKFAPRLAVIARSHSYDMALRHYLAHASPDGLTPGDRLRGVGIHYETVGENIYKEDFPEHDTMPERAVRLWLNSPPHRANILSPDFRATGIGVAYSSDGQTYITQDFMR
jgi:uncharacterized protein YkwD